MLPSASMGNPDGPGVFEPCHGSAPDIAGQDKANPLVRQIFSRQVGRKTVKTEMGGEEMRQNEGGGARETSYVLGTPPPLPCPSLPVPLNAGCFAKYVQYPLPLKYGMYEQEKNSGLLSVLFPSRLICGTPPPFQLTEIHPDFHWNFSRAAFPFLRGMLRLRPPLLLPPLWETTLPPPHTISCNTGEDAPVPLPFVLPYSQQSKNPRPFVRTTEPYPYATYIQRCIVLL